jgi:hypothetical protein
VQKVEAKVQEVFVPRIEEMQVDIKVKTELLCARDYNKQYICHKLYWVDK